MILSVISGDFPSAKFRVEQARQTAREGLNRIARARAEYPCCSLEGKLLRPVTALAGVPSGEWGRLNERFWRGALAIQAVHEASLLHDDIVDGADRRRGVPTVQAEAGVARALIEGDHLLTAAYRIAASTDSPSFLKLFIRAVERTVAGERSQGETVGRRPSDERYREILRGKAGELFGCALALAPSIDVAGSGEPSEESLAAAALGREIGILYQRVDDFLDFCSVDAGKPSLQDYRQEKWTWPLSFSDVEDFSLSPDGLAEVLFTSRHAGTGSPMREAFSELLGEAEAIERAMGAELRDHGLLSSLLESWMARAEGALRLEERRREEQRLQRHRSATSTIDGGWMTGDSSLPGSLIAEAAMLGDRSARRAYFSTHSKSFRFASLLFPREERHIVTAVYAFCRFTDDLIDGGERRSVGEREERLDEWLALTRAAYRGEETGVRFLDEVMRVTADRGVPLRYAEALVEGVRMDLLPCRYESLKSLRTYTYRVASAVGLWLTELFGRPSHATLTGAEALGHAMQLTNILRDVGEDCRAGRVYLPRDRMRAHGISPEMLHGMALGEDGVTAEHLEGYRGLLEELMEEAEREYALAFQAIPTLPLFFQRPVAVAAHLYRGIHAEIRGNGFDNLSRRAHTSMRTKLVVASRALIELRKSRRTGALIPLPHEAGPEKANA